MLPSFPFAVLDTEATGILPRVDRLLEIAVVRYEGGREVARFASLLACEVEIPRAIQVLTRIRPEDLRGMPTLSSVWAQVRQLLRGAVVIGHNIPFDLAMLRAQGCDCADAPNLDTALLASLTFPEARSCALAVLSTLLSLPHAPRHRALGDALAASALFDRICGRLVELPSSFLPTLTSLLGRAPEAYRRLFTSLPLRGDARSPSWLNHRAARHPSRRPRRQGALPVQHPLFDPSPPSSPSPPTVRILDIPPGVSPWEVLPSLPHASGGGRTWVAVRNLEASLSRTPPPADVTVLSPPHALLDPAALQHLQEKPMLSTEEFLLTLSLTLRPTTARRELRLYGEQASVVAGLLAASPASPVYLDQFTGLQQTVLLDHQHLLTLLTAGRRGPVPPDRVVVADASILEDAVTHACGSRVVTDHLRAALSDPALQQLLDLLEIFLQRVRGSQEVVEFSPAHLHLAEAARLRAHLRSLLTPASHLPDHARRALEALNEVLRGLDPGRITWAEQSPTGGQELHAVPRDPAAILSTLLFGRVEAVLLSPPKGDRILRPILPSPPRPVTAKVAPIPLLLSIESSPLPDLLHTPPPGPLLLLLPSRRTLEDLFCASTLPLEAQKRTLIVQGMSGGLARMEGEFTSAGGAGILALTPWMYEGIDLPEDFATELWITRLPFDHPNHTVLSKRATRFRNAFEEYFLPRLLGRLHRILSTFIAHAKVPARVRLLDERLTTRDYGAKILTYLQQMPGVEMLEQGDRT